MRVFSRPRVSPKFIQKEKHGTDVSIPWNPGDHLLALASGHKAPFVVPLLVLISFMSHALEYLDVIVVGFEWKVESRLWLVPLSFYHSQIGEGNLQRRAGRPFSCNQEWSHFVCVERC